MLLPPLRLKKKNYIEEISKCKPQPLPMCTAHHIGICPLNVRPPKTRSREKVESRQRRLGRIDSFSRGAAAEPFPGWQLAGGAAAGEQRRGPSPPPLASRPPPSTMEPRSRPPPLLLRCRARLTPAARTGKRRPRLRSVRSPLRGVRGSDGRQAARADGVSR